MKNPLTPFAAIMVGGIILVFVIAVYGATQGGGQGGEKAKDNNKDQKQEKKQEAKADPEDIFKENCASCHGENLEGGNGPELDKIGKKLSKDDIHDQIKNGGGGMPAGIIKGDEADAVAKWLSKKK